MEEGLIATCAIVDLEVLYSSRNLSDYEGVLEERRSMDSAAITPQVMTRAIELHTSWPSTANTGSRYRIW